MNFYDDDDLCVLGVGWEFIVQLSFFKNFNYHRYFHLHLVEDTGKSDVINWLYIENNQNML